MTSLQKFADGVHITEYPIRFAGCRFNARMTVLRLGDGRLALHSPCHIDLDLKKEIEQLGEVTYIIASGNYHYLHVAQCKRAFPSAQVYVSPGLEQKQPQLLDLGAKVLNDKDFLDKDLMHIFLSGNNVINEIVFYHASSKTLVLTDSIEYIGDDDITNTNWVLRMWWFLLGMWNKPKPAPEYQMGWVFKNKAESRQCMEAILKWDFDKAIVAHGQNITSDCKTVVRQAWSGVLE